MYAWFELTTQARIQAMIVKKTTHRKSMPVHVYVSTAASVFAPDAYEWLEVVVAVFCWAL